MQQLQHACISETFVSQPNSAHAFLVREASKFGCHAYSSTFCVTCFLKDNDKGKFHDALIVVFHKAQCDA